MVDRCIVCPLRIRNRNHHHHSHRPRDTRHRDGRTHAQVKIVQGDKTVDQPEVTQSQPAKLTLRSGKYIVELTGIEANQMEVKNNQILLSRGEKQIVSVIRKGTTHQRFLPSLAIPNQPFRTKPFRTNHWKSGWKF